LRKEKTRSKATAKRIEEQIREYAKYFLKTEYGDQALKRLEMFDIKAVDAHDTGGVSEVTGKDIKIAVRRDMDAGKLTNTTKLVIRHELGHILDENSPAFPEFEEQIEHEEIAWVNAKPKTPAEHWYKNVSIRTHMDPLEMQSIGFPRPETKVSPELLKRGISMELKRMKRHSPLADEILAKRYVLANLIEDPNYYNLNRYS
jgi:hypothetical protein